MNDGEREHDGEGRDEHAAPTHVHEDDAAFPKNGDESFGFDIALGDEHHREPVDEISEADGHAVHGDHVEQAHTGEGDETEAAASLPAVIKPGESGRPHDAGLDARMSKLRVHLRRHAARVTTEVAAKLSLVAPFITALGYDVFDPDEVVPEYSVNGARADYAVCDGEAVRILFGYVPSVAEVSANHLNRLATGVEASGSACAIVTDGRTADIHGLAFDGRMDERPLVSVRLHDGDEVPLALHAITRDGWNMEAFRVLGQTERERHVVREALLAELQDPTTGFIEAVQARLRDAGHQVGDGTRLVIESQALAIASGAGDRPEPVTAMPSNEQAETDEDRRMAPDEEAAFNKIRTICSNHINPGRIFARPAKSYIAVLLDDNNRRSIARIHFKADRAKYIGTFIGQTETRNEVASPADIQSLNDKIIARVHELDRA